MGKNSHKTIKDANRKGEPVINSVTATIGSSVYEEVSYSKRKSGVYWAWQGCIFQRQLGQHLS